MAKKIAKNEADFEAQFRALEKITADFEAGKFDLATGLKKFEAGLALAQTLKQHLTEVEQTIETIKGKYHELASEDATKD